MEIHIYIYAFFTQFIQKSLICKSYGRDTHHTNTPTESSGRTWSVQEFFAFLRTQPEAIMLETYSSTCSTCTAFSPQPVTKSPRCFRCWPGAAKGWLASPSLHKSSISLERLSVCWFVLKLVMNKNTLDSPLMSIRDNKSLGTWNPLLIAILF